MAEEGLDTADVGAVTEKIGRKTVAECVWVNVFDDAGGQCIVLDDTLNGSWGEAQGGIFFLIELGGKSSEEGFVDVASFVEIFLDGNSRGVRDKNESNFISFSAHAQLLGLYVDLTTVEGCEFAHAESGGEKKLEKGFIAKGSKGIFIWLGEETFHFLGTEKFDGPFRNLWDGEFFGGESGDIAKCQELEKASKGDNGVSLSSERDGLSELIDSAIEMLAVGCYGSQSDIIGGSYIFGRKKITQRVGVVADSEPASAFFQLQKVEKFRKGRLDIHIGLSLIHI